MRVTIRKFEKRDIPAKVEWVNNPANNRYLHYDLPLEVGKTERWFDNNKDRTDRLDCVIEADGTPVGLIGLLSIDRKNSKAEYYVQIGDTDYKGKGVAKEASRLILREGFTTLGLNRIYLYTEVENISAQKLYERVGFVMEGRLKKDVFSHGQYADRFVYGILREDWEKADGRDVPGGSQN